MRRGRILFGLVFGVCPFGAMGACSSEPPSPGRFLDATVDPSDAEARETASGEGARADAPDAPASEAGGDAGDGGARGDGAACAPPSPCTTARDLGALSGDTNQDTASAQGTTSEWLQVRVAQNTYHVVSGDMKATFSLVSPAGSNFDLYVYFNPDQDAVVCAPPEAASSTQQSGISDTLTLTWGHALTTSADSRTISVEVRWVSGPCDPGQPWTLLVQGNK